MAEAAIPLMIASTAGSMVMQRKAASAQAVAIQNDAAMAADQAKSAANEQTIARKEKLLQALSSQMAGSGASGAGLSGSTYNIMQMSHISIRCFPVFELTINIFKLNEYFDNILIYILFVLI